MYNQVSIDEEGQHQDKVRVNLPIHTMLLKSIDNVQITCHDGFLLIEADPKKFDEKNALMNFKNENTDRVDNEIYTSQKEDNRQELTVQVDTIKDLFANIEENMMNVYTITRRKLKKTIVKRIPESSIEDVAHYGRKAVGHIV